MALWTLLTKCQLSLGIPAPNDHLSHSHVWGGRAVAFVCFLLFLWVCDFVFSTKSNQFSSWFNWLDDELGLSLSTFSPEIFTATLVEGILLSSAVSSYYLKFCLFVLFFAISEVHQPVQITKLLQDKSSKVSINCFLCSTCANQKVFVRTVN